MKDFVKMTLAVLCGLFIAGILGFFFFFAMVGAMAASGSKTTVLPREGILDIDMSTFVLGEQSQEAAPSFNLSSIGGEMTPTIGILDASAALRAAAADPGVKLALLRVDGAAAGIASIQEFRAALQEYRRSGKALVAYTESPGNGSYYLATAADKIFSTSCHGGQISLLGLSGRLIFLKDLLDRLGVNVQLIRHGKYKSAGEMFIRNSSSPENYEQNKVMVESIWKAFASDIAEARGISVEQLNSIIDNLELNFPEDLKEKGLVDELFTREELIVKLADLAVISDKKNLHLIPFVDYVSAKVHPATGKALKNQVAVIFAEGDIVDGNDDKGVAGNRFARIIAKVREDDAVKAVVLRVNSPGGSVLASEKIKNELDLLKEKKHLIASYGDYAASGGYWISNNCEKIYSDATTLTGSIGVFSMIPDFSRTVKDVAHVNITSVPTNKHSDMFSLMRPFDADEIAYMQASIEDIYDKFVGIVSEGRSLTREHVDSVAQGRVWTGSDALGIGLVDEIGTLEDAIAYAASLAGYVSKDDYSVVSYPKPKSMMETVMEMLGQKSGPDELSILAGTPFEGLSDGLRRLRDNEPAKVYATIPYAIAIR